MLREPRQILRQRLVETVPRILIWADVSRSLRGTGYTGRHRNENSRSNRSMFCIGFVILLKDSKNERILSCVDYRRSNWANLEIGRI